MAPLTPEKRLDKNGRLVTRHVRSESSTRTTVLPPPSAAPVDDSGKARNLLWKNLSSPTEYVEKAVNDIDIEVVHRINDFYDKYRGRIVRELADATCSYVTNGMKTQRALSYVDRLSKHFAMVDEWDIDIVAKVNIINGLTYMNYRSQSTMTEDQERAVLLATKTVIYENPHRDFADEDYQYSLLNGIWHHAMQRDMYDLVKTNPDQVEAIRGYIRDGYASAAQIEAMLEGVPSALTDGAL